MVYVPSFWDSLSGGVEKGMDFYERERARKLAEQQAEFQRNSTMANLLFQQANAGAPVNDQISELMGKLGVKDYKAQETGAQLQGRVLATPDLSVSGLSPEVRMGGKTIKSGIEAKPLEVKGFERFTDDQLSKANLKTRGERKKDAFESLKVDVGMNAVNGVKQDPWTEQVILGNNRQSFQTKQDQEMFEALTAKAMPYVATTVNLLKKPLTRENLGTIAKASYERWLATEGGRVSPEMRTNGEAYFQEAVRKLFWQDEEARMAQEEMRLRERIARINQAGTGSGGDTPVDVLRALTNMANSVQTGLKQKYANQYDDFILKMSAMSQMSPEMAAATAESLGPRFKEFLADQKKYEGVQQMQVDFVNKMNTGITAPSMTGGGAPSASHGTGTLLKDNAGRELNPTFTTGRTQDRTGRWLVTPQEADKMKKLGTFDVGSYAIQP